jgi:hypothetical protein
VSAYLYIATSSAGNVLAIAWSPHPRSPANYLNYFYFSADIILHQNWTQAKSMKVEGGQ